MKSIVSIILIGLVFSTQFACQSVSDEKVGITFDEPENPQVVSPVQDWEKLGDGIQLGWGSSNTRYHKDYIPDLSLSDTFSCTAWKNERVYALLLAWSSDQVDELAIETSSLESTTGTIEAGFIQHFFIRNVITDEFLGGCEEKTKTQETAHLLPDCLEEAKAYNMRSKSTRGIWFNINLPEAAQAGRYFGDVIVKVKGRKVKTLKLQVDVLDRKLPSAKDWEFHLDLWQNPYAVARIHDVELWSDAHFELMTPLYSMLADAGQKCITASILNKPWGGQTYDPFESMIKHTLKQNGEWVYDYSIFDKWVSFMMDLGINKQINCYSLIPWGNQLDYFDESTGSDTLITAEASSAEYAEYWIPFLKDFKRHLKEKGIYEITTIAMDERPMEDMLSAIKLIQEYSGLLITSAANYDPGMSSYVYDLSVAIEHPLSPQIIADRRNDEQLTTYYVCCVDPYPNNFTYSPPAEGIWQGWFAFAHNMDGFLRWAYNSWVEDPLHDSRFRTWPSGDTYFVYPGARSSIRFEKLREGIQDYEKLRILTEELRSENSEEAKARLQELQNMLKEFELSTLEQTGAETMIQKGKDLLHLISF